MNVGGGGVCILWLRGLFVCAIFNGSKACDVVGLGD